MARPYISSDYGVISTRKLTGTSAFSILHSATALFGSSNFIDRHPARLHNADAATVGFWVGIGTDMGQETGIGDLLRKGCPKLAGFE